MNLTAQPTISVATPSLYSLYIKEREGFDILETPKGFATYRIDGSVCYIRDIYVLPEQRKHGMASVLADEIAALARDAGCTCLTGSIDLRTKGADASLKVLLAYGFRVSESHEGYFILRKEIHR